MLDPLLRPEVLMAQQAREEARYAEEFWASLTDHEHWKKDEDLCEAEDCYEAWHAYPDG